MGLDAENRQKDATWPRIHPPPRVATLDIGILATRRARDSGTLSAWLRPGAAISAKVVAQIEKRDSYRDVAVVAIPSPTSPKGRAYRIPEIKVKDGTS